MMNNQLQTKINETFLTTIEKLASIIKIPKIGYTWTAKYTDNDLIELTYKNEDTSNSCYIDLVEKRCINGPNNHSKEVCKVTEIILGILVDH